eukprot:5728228-Pleurochrysis_carterae.AAC.1
MEYTDHCPHGAQIASRASFVPRSCIVRVHTRARVGRTVRRRWAACPRSLHDRRCTRRQKVRTRRCRTPGSGQTAQKGT